MMLNTRQAPLAPSLLRPPPAVSRVRGWLIAATAAVSLLAMAGSARAQMQCRGGTIEFFPDGAIKGCVIEAIHEIHVDAGWLKCAPNQTMTRHANGRLESCTLFEAAEFEAVDCPADALVTFDEDGNLERCD